MLNIPTLRKLPVLTTNNSNCQATVSANISGESLACCIPTLEPLGTAWHSTGTWKIRPLGQSKSATVLSLKSPQNLCETIPIHPANRMSHVTARILGMDVGHLTEERKSPAASSYLPLAFWGSFFYNKEVAETHNGLEPEVGFSSRDLSSPLLKSI